MKKKKSIHESFESSYQNGKFYKITDDMVKSKAWQELNLMERGLYFEFKTRYTKHKDGSTNVNDISMPKKDYSELMNERTFFKCIDHIINLGLIRVVENRWTTRECTIYGFSNQWQYYGTGKFNVTDKDRRAKRSLSEEHIENIRKGLEATNKKRAGIK